tara:strand:- start:177 stop:815 length:639 start_codon:yes stop_codon:yes gene_type:complete
MTAKIKLNAASGGGSVSLKAPSTTTSNAAVELQLPVEDGSADTFLKTNGSGTLSFAAAGGGKVLQVVNALTSSATTITSNSFTDTGVTDSITTTAANSTILVLGSMAYDTARDDHFSGARIRIVRTIGGSDSAFMESSSDKNVGAYISSSSHFRVYGQYPLNFHDSGLSSVAAGTTITYKVQGRVENTGANDDLRINNGAKFSTIILVEIGA